MRLSLLLTVLGGVILFAIHGNRKISWLPWLDLRAFGWVIFLAGIGFAVAWSTPHYHRWRSARIEDD